MNVNVLSVYSKTLACIGQQLNINITLKIAYPTVTKVLSLVMPRSCGNYQFRFSRFIFPGPARLQNSTSHTWLCHQTVIIWYENAVTHWNWEDNHEPPESNDKYGPILLQRVSIACYAERCISYDRFCPTVWPSDRLTVCHSPVSCQNDSSYDHAVFTGG